MILFGMPMVKPCSKATILCGAIFFSYISYVFVNRNEDCFAFMRTMQFFPFFVMGYLGDEKLLSKISFRENSMVLIVLSLFAVFGIFSFSGRNLHILEFQRSGILSIMNTYQCSYIYALLLKTVLLLVQIILCYTILLLFCRLPKLFIEFSSLYGHHTLLIYFLQDIATKALTYHMKLPFWSAFPFCILLIIISLCIAKNKMLSSFVLNPISELHMIVNQNIDRKNTSD